MKRLDYGCSSSAEIDAAVARVRAPLDQYAMGEQTSERWYAAVEEMQRRVRAELAAVIAREVESAREARRKDDR